MKQVQFLKTNGILVINPPKVVIALLLAAMLGVFLDARLCLILGPFMAVAFAYLYFSGYSPLVTAIIVVANDALGTIFLGSISFPYLLLGMAAVELVLRRKIKQSDLIYLAVAAFMILQIYIAGVISVRTVIYTFTFVFALIILPRDKESLKQLFAGIATSVLVICLHACFTGGVGFYEVGEYHSEAIRKGVLGVGIGDANFSCMLILIGMVCVWYLNGVSTFWKTVLTGVMLFAMMVTLSTSGLLALLLVALFASFLGEKKSKSLIAILLVFLVAVCLLQVYVNLPADMRNVTLDGYINRMETKLFQAQSGDLNSVTTGRSGIMSAYLKYIYDQSAFTLLLGGNKLVVASGTVSHNTYIDLVLRIGILGAIAFLIWLIWRFYITAARAQKDGCLKTTLLLKVVCLFFAFTLSIHSGSLWCLWMYFLIVL